MSLKYCITISRGAKVVLATAPSGKAVEDIVPGLGVEGKVIIVGAIMQPLNIAPVSMLSKRQSIVNWASGDSRDAAECLEFCVANGIVPMVEEFPLSKANEAFEHMLSNKARFRVVIKVADA